ncbi:MAG: fused MFS/spermidine synthase [Bryobacterales bacterium]|nr:fused MFS/spermidine synthase [Bryobacterales bacterium]
MTGRVDRVLFACTVFLSSALLFLIQPMVVQAILPRFGGSASVWTASMLFFQFALLVGYLYAYAVTHFLPSGTREAVHLALLSASALALPVALPAAAKASENPVWSILALLAVLVGLPYVALSTTGPLVQWWYAGTLKRSPYRLFALSNVASLLALFAYPPVIQPLLPVRRQLSVWSAAFVLFLVLCGASALRGRRAAGRESIEGAAIARHQAWLWVLLAACPSILWLAVANHLSQEVAAVPFLWVGLLGLYLLSLVLCFDHDGWYRPALFRWLVPAACLAMGWRLARPGPGGGFLWEFALYCAGVLICCVFFHGELVLRKPHPGPMLTYFYLAVAAGGALGGIFVALAAPVLFNSYLELPVAIILCLVMALVFLFGYKPRRLLRLSVVLALTFVIAAKLREGDSVLETRNFYGALRVVDSGEGVHRIRTLYHGVIRHGTEYLSPNGGHVFTTYYTPLSGIGITMAAHHQQGRRVGVVGLGAGTLAAYGQPGDTFRFFEINPAVTQIASAYFRFLRDSRAHVEVVPGDGRLALEREALSSFDILVLDAFSGDSAPVHLLTREAFQLYLRCLRPGGVIAVNITNRYLDIGLPVRAAAWELHKKADAIHSEADPAKGIEAADWMILTDLPPAAAPSAPRIRAWTDDYNSLFQILKK